MSDIEDLSARIEVDVTDAVRNLQKFIDRWHSMPRELQSDIQKLQQVTAQGFTPTIDTRKLNRDAKKAAEDAAKVFDKALGPGHKAEVSYKGKTTSSPTPWLKQNYPDMHRALQGSMGVLDRGILQSSPEALVKHGNRIMGARSSLTEAMNIQQPTTSREAVAAFIKLSSAAYKAERALGKLSDEAEKEDSKPRMFWNDPNDHGAGTYVAGRGINPPGDGNAITDMVGGFFDSQGALGSIGAVVGGTGGLVLGAAGAALQGIVGAGQAAIGVVVGLGKAIAGAGIGILQTQALAAAAGVTALAGAFTMAASQAMNMGLQIVQLGLGPVMQGVGALKAMRMSGGGNGGVNKARQVRDAIWALKDAEERLKEATKGLSEARRNAALNLRDYRLTVQEAALAEESAIDRLEDAQKRLNKIQGMGAESAYKVAQATDEFTGKVYDIARTAEDAADAEETYEDAQRDVAAAELELARAKNANTDAQYELNKMEAKGVEGSDLVKAALKEQRNATRALIQAREGLKDARKGSGGGMSSWAQATKELSPIAQDFVKFIVDKWEPAVRKLTFASQNAFLPGAKVALTNLMTYFPRLEKTVTSVAGSFGKGAASLSKWLVKPEQRKTVDRILTGFEKFFKDVLKPSRLKAVGGALLFGIDKAMPVFNTITSEVMKGLTGVAKWVTGDGEPTVKGFFKGLNRLVKEGGDLVNNHLGPAVGYVIGKLFPDDGKKKTSLVDSVVGALKGMGDWLDDKGNLDGIVDGLRTAYDFLKGFNGLLGGLGSDFLKWLADPKTKDSIGKVFTGIQNIPWDKIQTKISSFFSGLGEDWTEFQTGFAAVKDWFERELSEIDWADVGKGMADFANGFGTLMKIVAASSNLIKQAAGLAMIFIPGLGPTGVQWLTDGFKGMLSGNGTSGQEAGATIKEAVESGVKSGMAGTPTSTLPTGVVPWTPKPITPPKTPSAPASTPGATTKGSSSSVKPATPATPSGAVGAITPSVRILPPTYSSTDNKGKTVKSSGFGALFPWLTYGEIEYTDEKGKKSYTPILKPGVQLNPLWYTPGYKKGQTGGSIKTKQNIDLELKTTSSKVGAKIPGNVIKFLDALPGMGSFSLAAKAYNAIPREYGGRIRKGQAYLVGERRPELIVPDYNGTVLPRVPEGNGGGGLTKADIAALMEEMANLMKPNVDQTFITRENVSPQEMLRETVWSIR